MTLGCGGLPLKCMFMRMALIRFVGLACIAIGCPVLSTDRFFPFARETGLKDRDDRRAGDGWFTPLAIRAELHRKFPLGQPQKSAQTHALPDVDEKSRIYTSRNTMEQRRATQD